MTAAPRPIREAEFQNNVAVLARMLGWKVVHFGAGQTKKGYRTPVRYDAKGFVDLVLFHPDRGIIFAELKSAKGRPTVDQQHWAERIRAAGGDYRLWRPDDMDTVIPSILAGRPVTRAEIG